MKCNLSFHLEKMHVALTALFAFRLLNRKKKNWKKLSLNYPSETPIFSYFEPFFVVCCVSCPLRFLMTFQGFQLCIIGDFISALVLEYFSGS